MPHATSIRHDRPTTVSSPGWRAWARARRDARRAQPGPIRLPSLRGDRVSVETSAGAVSVRLVGDGPAVVFVHGLLVDGHVWDGVAGELCSQYRCVLPDLPLGSHRAAMRPGADVSPVGVASLLGELLEALDLTDVTVVANDSGGAITQLWMPQMSERVGRVVLTPSDCFDNFLPTGFVPYEWAARSPQLTRALLRAATRVRAMRHLPVTYGGLTHRPVDDELARRWVAPGSVDDGVLRDLCGFLRGIDARVLIEAAARLGTFERPVLLAWSDEQRWFPIEHAWRLAGVLPDATIAVVPGSGAFPQLDAPAHLAMLIDEFVTARAVVPARGPVAH